MRLFDASKDLPIVYSPQYNMSMVGVELLHHFDTQKYGKIAAQLDSLFLDTPFARHIHHDDDNDNKVENPGNPVKPRQLRYLEPNRPVGEQELVLHHSLDYVAQVHESKSLVARITETWLLNLMPAFAIESRLLQPLKWQISGTIFAAHLAMQHGWAINLGGGFHQARARAGETFCIFSDVLLAMKFIWRKHPFQKFMIVDLDAHQGTGIARDLSELEAKRRAQVFMVDVFNSTIQPPDSRADHGLNVRVELGRFTGDDTYLKKVGAALDEAFAKFKPTLVIYIAGQDILKNDRLGLMNISDSALKRRDELVFSWATEKAKCSIVMLLGGGYLIRSTEVQAESIRNLFARGLIWGGHRDGMRTLSRPRPGPHNTATKSTRTHSSSQGKSSTKQPEVPQVANSVRSSPSAKTAVPGDHAHAQAVDEPAPGVGPVGPHLEGAQGPAGSANTKTRIIRAAPIEDKLLKRKQEQRDR